MTIKTKANKAELLASLTLAVQACEDQWDAERDIEMTLGGDVDGLSGFVQDLAVAGAESLTLENVEDLLTTLDLVPFKA